MAKVKKISKKFPEKSKGNYFDTVKSTIEALKEMTAVMEKTISAIERFDKRLQILEGKYANQRRSK